MRTLAVFLILTTPILALAEGPTTPIPQPAQPVENVLGDSGHALLELSPMYVEIKDVIEKADKREAELLRALAAATTDEEVQGLILQIENLAVDRELDLLRIQARYARLDGRLDLEKRLKQKMTEVVEACGRKPLEAPSVQAVQ
jgi:hypothetical protein